MPEGRATVPPSRVATPRGPHAQRRPQRRRPAARHRPRQHGGAVINAVIGAGIFGLPSRVHALLGPYALLAYLACAVLVLLVVLCFAEVGSRFERTGGPYLRVRPGVR
jgi:hypothetical protein